MGEPQISPAQETARKMEKTIHDQLLDTSAVNVLRHSIFECALLGTGVIKGPFSYNKKVHQWMGVDEEKSYEPYDKEVPKTEMMTEIKKSETNYWYVLLIIPIFSIIAVLVIRRSRLSANNK